ncbi:MAG: DUF5658 family protein [Dehalococcoidales bacterium]
MNNSENPAGCQPAAGGWTVPVGSVFQKTQNCTGKVWFGHLDRAVLMGDNSTILAGNVVLGQAISSFESGNILVLRTRRFSGHITIKYLIAALAILVVTDGLISHFLINNGLAQEGNPLLVVLVGKWNFLAIKVAGAAVCSVILWDIYKSWPKLALVSTSCFVSVYAVIVSWNVSIFFMQ